MIIDQVNAGVLMNARRTGAVARLHAPANAWARAPGRRGCVLLP